MLAARDGGHGRRFHEAIAFAGRAAWLRMVQNSAGGWGRDLRIDDDRPRAGLGRVRRRRQLGGAGALGGWDTRRIVAKGVAYLLRTQLREDLGIEPQSPYGFPRGFI